MIVIFPHWVKAKYTLLGAFTSLAGIASLSFSLPFTLGFLWWKRNDFEAIASWLVGLGIVIAYLLVKNWAYLVYVLTP